MVISDQKQKLEEKLDAVINDPVNHPSHYTSSKIEVIEYILCCLLFYFPQIGTSFGKLKEASPRTK